jgi:hypothetical protein
MDIVNKKVNKIKTNLLKRNKRSYLKIKTMDPRITCKRQNSRVFCLK